jgi:hypothetical protein
MVAPRHRQRDSSFVSNERDSNTPSGSFSKGKGKIIHIEILAEKSENLGDKSSLCSRTKSRKSEAIRLILVGMSESPAQKTMLVFTELLARRDRI